MKIPSYPSQPITLKPQPTRFGMSPGIQVIDRSLGWLQANRTREMFFEDFVGFGVMRTALDLGRQYFFKQDGQQPAHRELNFPAARERLIREVGSILTDNVSGGLIAYGLAKAWNQSTPNFSNQFASNQTLNLFEQLAKTSNSKQAFLQALAKRISPDQAKPLYTHINWVANKAPSSKLFNDNAVAMARILNPKDLAAKRILDVQINKSWFALNTLLDDTSAFTKRVDTLKGGSWSKKAMNLLSQTGRVNRSRLLIGLGTAMGLTMAVPFINQYITRKVDKIESYPGELGLRQMKRVSQNENKTFMERYFPYLSESLKKGNPLPMLGALATLPFAFGMVDTTKLSSGQGLKALNLPFVQTWGTFFKRMGNMMQFGKGMPFTTQQQMASCFAFLIFSRLATSRSDIEYRERMVDSFLGWSVWILATPFIKRKFAQWMDPNLIKNVGGQHILKSRLEIERLLPKKAMGSALGKYIGLSAGSLGLTLLLMGLVEPLIAIKWTERQTKKSA